MHELSMHTVIHTSVDVMMHGDSMRVNLGSFSSLNMHFKRWEKLRKMLLLNPLKLMLGLMLL